MESLDIKTLLEEFGLTKAEARIFYEINNNGSARIGKVVKATKLHRGTTYNTIQRLIDKGLVFSNKNNKSTFYYINPKGFLSLIDEEKESLERKKEIINKIQSCMKISKTLNHDNKPAIYSLEGERAFKGFFLDLLETSKRKGYYLYLGNGGDMRDRLGGPYYRRSQNIKVLLGTRCKVILNINKETHKFASEVRGNLKWLPKENNFSSVDSWIYDNKTVIVDWKSNPLTTIIIEDKNISKFYNSIWKNFWNKSAVKKEELYSLTPT